MTKELGNRPVRRPSIRRPARRNAQATAQVELQASPCFEGLKRAIRARLNRRSELEAGLAEAQRELDFIEAARLQNSCGLIANTALFGRMFGSKASFQAELADLGPARPLAGL